MQLPGVGRVLFWPGGSLWIGMAIVLSEMHSHHAIQISLGLDGMVQLHSQRDPRWQSYSGAVIPSQLHHSFQAPGVRAANIFFEPQSVLGRAAMGRFHGDRIAELEAANIACWTRRLAEALETGLPDSGLEALAHETIASICGADAFPQPADERVLRAIEVIHARLDEPLTLGEVASEVGLSEGRLRHLFVAETGTAFRSFVLWSRLNRAIQTGFESGNWTEAAYAANFADSAHLSRTCRRMFGFAPSSMRSRNLARSASA